MIVIPAVYGLIEGWRLPLQRGSNLEEDGLIGSATQNLSKRHNIIDDIAYAESQGVAFTYGYLFDPRHQTASEMERQICARRMPCTGVFSFGSDDGG